MLIHRVEDIEAMLPQRLTVRVRISATGEVLFLALVDDWDAVVHDDEGCNVHGAGHVGGVVGEAWNVLVSVVTISHYCVNSEAMYSLAGSPKRGRVTEGLFLALNHVHEVAEITVRFKRRSQRPV